MNNLLILGFFYYADGYYALAQYFNLYFDKVEFCPFMMYMDNANDLKNYNLVNDIKSKVLSDNITHILVWHNIDSIYRTMDKIFSCIDNIKTSTFNSTCKLMPNDVEIILFDVTTLYFELAIKFKKSASILDGLINPINKI